MYLKLVSPEVKIEFLNSIFNCQSFFVSCMIVKLCWLKLSTSMSVVEFSASNFFYENCSPVLVTSICLQIRFPSPGILRGGGFFAACFRCFTASVCSGPHGGAFFLRGLDRFVVFLEICGMKSLM